MILSHNYLDLSYEIRRPYLPKHKKGRG